MNTHSSHDRITAQLIGTLLLTFSLATFPKTAFADVGLPLVAVFLPPMWLGLIPIIFIETIIISRMLSIPFRKTIMPVTLGNIASTIVGIPIVWITLASVELIFFGTAIGLQTPGAKIYAVTIQSPWLIPYEQDFWWMIPAALVVFSIPCFMISVLVEAPINRLALSLQAPPKLVWKTTAIANLASYICLGLLTWGEFLLQNDLKHIGSVFMPVSEWIASSVFHIASIFVHN